MRVERLVDILNVFKLVGRYTDWVYEIAGGPNHKYIASIAHKLSMIGPYALYLYPAIPKTAVSIALGGVTIGILDADRIAESYVLSKNVLTDSETL